MAAKSEAKTFHALLDLLDHQILDVNGVPCGNVDDLELDVPADGSPPRVTAILGGPMALGPRIGGRLGEWISALGATMNPAEQPQPARVEIGDVVKIDSAVHLDRKADSLQINQSEEWVLTHVIGQIPGAHHETE